MMSVPYPETLATEFAARFTRLRASIVVAASASLMRPGLYDLAHLEDR
jgi:hypothetical protein